MAEKPSNVQMHHPDTGDVRVIPAVLQKRYADRGWKPGTPQASTSTSSSSRSSDK